VGLITRLEDRLIDKFIAKMAKVGGWNITNYQSGKAYYPDVSYKELVKRYSSWVYTCASKNAISCAQIPLRLYAAKPARKTKALFPTRRVEPKRLAYLAKSPSTFNYVRKAEEIEEVVEHPFLNLLKSVNDFTNQFDLLELMFLFQELCGNAYWHISRDNKLGVPNEIWPLYSQYVRIIPDKRRFIAKYEFVITEAEKHIIDPANIVHFKYINPQDAFYGIGPLQAAVVAADLSNNMNTFESTLFANRARPDMALILPPEAAAPPADEIKRIEKKWFQKFRGVKNTGKLAVLTGGAELKPISLTPKEMSFLQGRKATREEIAAIFGVPLSMLTTESVNRANAETGEYSYMKNTILPRTRRAEQKMNEKLLPMYDTRLFCAFDNPVPEDKEYRLKEIKDRLTTGMTSINEERQQDGLDEVEWGDEPIMPMNMRPLSTELPTPQLMAPKPEKGIKAPRGLPSLNHPTNFIDEPFVKAIRDYYNRVADVVLEGFDRDLAKAVKSSADDYMTAWFDMQKWNGELWTTSEPFIRFTMMAGGEQHLRQLTSVTQFDPMNPGVVRALSEHRYGSINSVNSTIVKNLREKLSAGMAEGEGIPDLRKRVSEVFEGLSRFGAERVARTETIWAWNEGARQGYKQSGIVEKLQWISSGDQRTCDWCLDMDGAIIGIDTSFFDKGDTYEVNGRELDFTYEKVDHPPIHCMCLSGDSLVLPVGRITAASKRWYNGKVHIIKTATNREFISTPNHPILGDNGFVPADALDIGDYVVSDSVSKGRRFSDWADVNKPALAKDIAETFFANPGVVTEEVPMTAPDFHGDGLGSKVAIVGTDSFLVNSINAANFKHLLESQFETRESGRSLFDSLSAIALRFPRLFTSLRSLMSRFDLSLTQVIRHLRPFEDFGFALSAGNYAGIEQSFPDTITAEPEVLSDSVFRPSSSVQFGNRSNSFFRDRIIHTKTLSYEDYVYNFQTTESYYISNGIASHNCRCTIVPILEGV